MRDESVVQGQTSEGAASGPGSGSILRSHKSAWCAFILLVLAVKLTVLYFDPFPMFFLGDSFSYLGTALTGSIPYDRSFVYGFLVKLVAVSTRSLLSLVAFQVFVSSLTAILAAYALARFFAVNPKLAFAMGFLCALEPLQLLHERYVMTEAVSLFLFAIFMITAFHYLERPRLPLLALVQIVGTMLISFRVSFLPIVILTATVLPLLGIPALRGSYPTQPGHGMPAPNPWLPRRAFAGTVVVHIVFSIGLAFCLHDGYKRFYGNLVDRPPAYMYESGFFLLSDWAPVVKPTDFPYPEHAKAVFGNLKYDLRDRSTRGPQRWMEGGLVENIKSVIPDYFMAERAAKQTALNALKRDPVAVAGLAVESFSDYWDRDVLIKWMVTDRGGDRELPAESIEPLKRHFRTDAEKLPFLQTLTNTHYYKNWPWYLVLLCSPLLAAVSFVFCRRENRGCLAIAALAALAIAGTACGLVERPTVRFLHAMGWLAFILAGPIAQNLFDNVRGKIVQYNEKTNQMRFDTGKSEAEMLIDNDTP